MAFKSPSEVHASFASLAIIIHAPRTFSSFNVSSGLFCAFQSQALGVDSQAPPGTVLQMAPASLDAGRPGSSPGPLARGREAPVERCGLSLLFPAGFFVDFTLPGCVCVCFPPVLNCFLSITAENRWENRWKSGSRYT